MTIWTIALLTGLAGGLWTILENYLSKTKDVGASFLKNWIAWFFVLSAVVKLDDPIGFGIKLGDYFDVFHLSFLKPTALFQSFVILIVEFVIAIFLMFNLYKQWTYRVLIAMIVFFTLLTGVSAIFNVVQDCGCFGDFIKLSPWTSFMKDVVILIMSLYITKRQDAFLPFFNKSRTQSIVAVLAVLVPLAFEMHNYFHLPVWDFRPYSVGTYIPDGMKEVKPAVYRNEMEYRNKATGETKVFVDSFPEDADQWEFVDRKQIEIEKGIPAPIHDFVLTTNDGSDVTEQLLQFDKPIVLIVSYDISKGPQKPITALKELVEASNDLDEFNYAFLTASNDADIEAWKAKQGFTGTNLNADATMLKTMIRANPGIVLLHKGTIIGKWNYRDTPSPEVIMQTIKYNTTSPGDFE